MALGPSGSGKTSLLNLIAGFIEPSAGRITLDGVPVKGPSAERGVVFQDDALLPWQDVLANVGFGLELAGVPKAQREVRAREMLALVDLAGFDSRRIWQLSGGQKQLIGLAQSLIRQPDLLLLDEPLSALDLNYQFHVMDIVARETRLRNIVTVVVIHDINIALRHAEYAVMLKEGALVASGIPGEVVTPANLATVYGVRGRVEYCSQGLPHVVVDGLTA